MITRKSFMAGILASAVSVFAGTAGAQEFPSKQVRIVVPFTPGASTDRIARHLAEIMGKEFGQIVLVDNVPGANGIIAVNAVLKEPADGHTVYFATDSSVIMNNILRDNTPYDGAKDLTGIGLAVEVPYMIVENVSAPDKDVNDFIARVKEHPGEMKFASVGIGSTQHLVMSIFTKDMGMEMLHVPYKGGTASLTSVLGGETDIYMGTVGFLLGHVEGGTVRPLVLMAPKRVSVLPDVPTFDEVGVKSLKRSATYGLMVKAGTPPDVIAALNKAMMAAIADEGYRSAREAEGLLVPDVHPASFYDDKVTEDRAAWTELVKANGFKID